MKLTKEGLDLIKKFEGLSLEAYRCPAGLWTIGYGHTKFVQQGDQITEKEANAYLIKDLQWAEHVVDYSIGVQLSDNQYSALVSLVFNIGKQAFLRSTLRRYLNHGNYLRAANELLRWNKVGTRVLKGLERRRKAEKALFEKD